MSSEYFVDEGSVVRRIWGKSETILFIFAGAAAEFALNKAVDWLYFTGRLPADPLERLFSTVAYARTIVFSTTKDAVRAIDTIAAIHTGVESTRGARIPDWAYRDVLFMLIDYSIRSFEVLERDLSVAERQEVFDVFHRVGARMGLKDLPATFNSWEEARTKHLREDMQYSFYSKDLFNRYRKHLGAARYAILRAVQALIAPRRVRSLLGLNDSFWLKPMIFLFKISRSLKVDWILKELLLPAGYKAQVKALDSAPAKTIVCPCHRVRKAVGACRTLAKGIGRS